MVLDNRIGTKTLCNFGTVVVFQITSGYVAHSNATGIEIGGYVIVQHIHILIVGCNGNMRTVMLYPFSDMLCQKGVPAFQQIPLWYSQIVPAVS